MLRGNLTLVLGVALIAACARAGGESTGGELTPAGEQAETPGAFTPPLQISNADCGTGTTWHSLYTDIIAPEPVNGQRPPGSCLFQPVCHGNPGSDDAHHNGFECYNEADCRTSIKALTLGTSPKATALYKILRKVNPDGSIDNAGTQGMPRAPVDFIWPQKCLDRITGWIAAGTPP